MIHFMLMQEWEKDVVLKCYDVLKINFDMKQLNIHKAIIVVNCPSSQSSRDLIAVILDKLIIIY